MLDNEGFEKYQNFIKKMNSNFLISKVEKYNLFVYKLLFAFVGQFKVNHIIDNCYFIIFDEQKEPNIRYNDLEFMEEIDEVSSFALFIEYFELMQLTQSALDGMDEILRSKDVYLQLIQKEMNPKGEHYVLDSLKKRSIFLFETLHSEKFVTPDEVEFIHNKRYKQWEKKFGITNQGINTLELLDKLGIFMEDKIPEPGECTAITFNPKSHYALNSLLLKHLNIDLVAALNQTTLSKQDLEKFTEVLSITYSFTSNWLAHHLTLTNAEAAVVPDNAFVMEIDMTVIKETLIQFCIYKYIQDSAGRFTAYTNGTLSTYFDGGMSMTEQLKIENTKLENELLVLKQQLQQAQLSLHNNDIIHANELQLLKEQMQQQMQEQKQQLELNKELDMADLKLEGIAIKEMMEDTVSVSEEINYLELVKDMKIVVIGGHSNFHTHIRNEFLNKNLVLIAPRNYTTPVKIINNADIIVFIDSYNNHGQFRRVMSEIRNTNTKYKLIYSNTQPQPNVLAKAIYEHASSL